MKWNWGTGIFIFLTIFVLACVAFVIFTLQLDVNLVHKDYYEKGADYSEQMRVEARSKPFARSVSTSWKDGSLLIEIEASLAAKIDSGRVWLYRPSDSRRDVVFSFFSQEKSFSIPGENLIPGRYILKLQWFDEGLKYQVDKPVSIQ